jgi:hypothetical protein
MDEFTWTDRDEARGRVIGYKGTRLEQPDCPDDVAATIGVGRREASMDTSGRARSSRSRST